MGMSNYTDMKATISRWLNRENFPVLEAEVDLFMDMAQRRIFRDCDLEQMLQTAAFDTTTLTVPADYLRTQTMTILQGNDRFEVKGASAKKVRQMQSLTERPRYFTVRGGVFVLGPLPDSTYSIELDYYGSLSLLSGAVATNWLVINVPELILFSALLEASVFLKDDQRAQVWNGRYDEVKTSLMASEERKAFEGGSLQVTAA